MSTTVIGVQVYLKEGLVKQCPSTYNNIIKYRQTRINIVKLQRFSILYGWIIGVHTHWLTELTFQTMNSIFATITTTTPQYTRMYIITRYKVMMYLHKMWLKEVDQWLDFKRRLRAILKLGLSTTTVPTDLKPRTLSIPARVYLI